jgi:hypothetical protein
MYQVLVDEEKCFSSDHKNPQNPLIGCEKIKGFTWYFGLANGENKGDRVKLPKCSVAENEPGKPRRAAGIS